MAEEVLKIVVDDGFRKIPIENENGDQIGIFYFNPGDVGIVKRYNEIAKHFDENVTAAVGGITGEIKPDGTGTTEEDIAALEAAEEALYKECNYLFGGDFAKAFFGRVNPFSVVDGNFYCENALNQVGDFIARYFDKEVEKINSRVNKYTHGVRTGRHKDGRK